MVPVRIHLSFKEDMVKLIGFCSRVKKNLVMMRLFIFIGLLFGIRYLYYLFWSSIKFEFVYGEVMVECTCLLISSKECSN